MLQNLVVCYLTVCMSSVIIKVVAKILFVLLQFHPMAHFKMGRPILNRVSQF